MPELIRLTRECLARNHADAHTVEAAWTVFYWAMGMVCTLQEAHALLGDLVPVIQATKDYKKVYGSAFRQGYSQALAEGPVLAIRALVAEQATQRFGEDEAQRSALNDVSALETLRAIAGRVPTATSWSGLFAGQGEHAE
jgi:hypothetical protein